MKTLNKNLIILFVLFACVLFCVVLSTTSNVAYADSSIVWSDNDYYVDYSGKNMDKTPYYQEYGVTNNAVENNRTGTLFGFEKGASVLANDLNTLIFKFNLLQPQYESPENYFSYVESFTIYECSRDSSTANPIISFLIYRVYNKNYNDILYLFKRYQYSDVKFGIKGYSHGGYYSNSYGALFSYGFVANGYEYIGGSNCAFPHFFGFDTSYLELAITTTSPYTRYFVRSETSDNMEVVLDSSVVSVYDVLKNMSSDICFDSLGENKDNAENIVYNNTTERIQVLYLKRIGETPFATPVTDYVEVPVTNNEIRVDDVRSALGLDTMAVMQSSCDYFKYDSENDIYRAYYLKSVWLSAKTADGKNQNIYLDCNLSFRDFYYPFVRDGIMDEVAYEYLLNRIKYNFSEVQSINEYNLYGYFGYAALPKTYSFSQLFFEVFDASKANFKGTVDVVNTLSSLSADGYQKLLEDYGYNWLGQAWNISVGAFAGYEAYHYSFYCDSGVIEAMIAHNGAKDMNDNASRVGVLYRDFVESTASFLASAFKKISSWFEKNSTLFVALTTVIFAIVLLLIVLRIVSKVTKSQKKQAKSASKSKKKKVKHAKKKKSNKKATS